ncbi:MAG: PAS domain S-box protein [Deltaproteobacteria bacterium]
MIYLDLVLNLALLVALTVVSGFIDKRWPRDTRPGVLLQGIVFGGVAILGMLRPLNLGPGLIFDGRSVMLSLCALFFGPWAAAVSCAIALASRVALGGVGMTMGVLVILESSIIGLLAYYRFRPSLQPPSILRLYGMGLAVHVVMVALMITLPEGVGLATLKRVGLPIVLLYPLATILAGTILSDHLATTQAAGVLSESEERYRLLFDASHDAILLTDPSGTIFAANPAACRIFGRSEEDIKDLGRNGIVDTADPRLSAALSERARTGKFTGELTFLRKDGSRFAGEVSTSIFQDRDHQPHTSMIIRDITERRQAEDALQASYRFLQMAYAQTDLSSLLEESVSEIRRYTGCSSAGIRLIDDEHRIPYEAYVGFSQKFYDSESLLSIQSDECMCINVITGDVDPTHPFYTPGGSFFMNRTNRFLATVSETEKGRTRNICNQAGYESVALIPIRLKQSIVGLIHVADPAEDKISLRMVESLETIGIQLGTAIMRISLEEELRENEVHFRTLADSGQALIWTSGIDKKCSYFNRTWLAFTGRTLEQEQGDGWVQGVHPDDLNRCVDTYVSAFDRREKFSMDYRIRRYDGEYRWIKDDGTPRFNSRGEFIGYIGHCLDITDHKQAEDNIRRLNDDLEQKVQERTAELKRTIAQLEETNKVFVGRELKMAELKTRIAELERRDEGD